MERFGVSIDETHVEGHLVSGVGFGFDTWSSYDATKTIMHMSSRW